MSKTPQRIIPWLAATALAISLSACSTPAEDSTMDPSAPAATVEGSLPPEALGSEASVPPIDPEEDSSVGEPFDGAGVTTDTITANMMDITIPSGLRIPENTLVTDAQEASIMMAEEDPAAVVAMVESSAAEAGYEVYAEGASGTVYVGNGNAVLFTADSMVQLLTWGPEAMKDVLAGS
ncbi:MAG: hypothetical protein ACTHWA_04065 [Arachnia sp.]